MDDAARRVRPSDLRSLLRCRQERERRALMEHAARIAARDAAALACDQARREAQASDAARRRGEAAIYGAMTGAGALSLAALDQHRAALERLSESVRQASRRVEDAWSAFTAAQAAAEETRALYASRRKDLHKWTQIDDRVGSARRVYAERLDELETEDETGLRFMASPAGGRGVEGP